MKTENTLENKERFFALYYGQHVLRVNPLWKLCVLDKVWNWKHESLMLELTPLSEITEDDAEELSLCLNTVVGINQIIQENSKELVVKLIENYSAVGAIWSLPSRFIDQARALGYAVDWLDLSVDDLVNYGWVKLKGKTQP